MEKTQSLAALDRQICDYHLKNNFSKKDNIFCYHPSRKQISEFYNSMADHFYHSKIKEPQPHKPNTHTHKPSSQIYHTITDPLHACLPRSIPQENVIDTDCMATGMSTVPMFSEVQATKKQKYLIARQVRELLGHDIKQMLKEKEQVLFRKHFPEKEQRNWIEQELQTEQLIKEFNRLLIKYKNNKINAATSLNLLEKENSLNFMGENGNDQKFKILNLFKKIYLETKSEDINQSLIDYLLKFHLINAKNIGNQARKSRDRSNRNSMSKPGQSLLNSKHSKNRSQASLLIGTKVVKSNFFQLSQPNPTPIAAKPRKEIKIRSRVHTYNQKAKLPA